MLNPEGGLICEMPIRWGDMDAIGHVNNTVFFQYCETARISYFEALRLDRYKRNAHEGPGLVAANLNFRRQLHYPGTVTVKANTTALSERSFTLSYTLLDQSNGSTVADGSSVCVWVDSQAAKATRLPDELVEAIVAFEGKPELRKGPKPIGS